MDISLTDLTKKIEEEDYLQDLATAKYADLSKSKAQIKPYAANMVKEVAAGLKHDALIQTSLEVSGQRPVTFTLEANIINLPYSNYKKVANFFEEGKTYPVNIYFETSSDYINASKFRIDLLAKSSDFPAKEAEITDELTQAIKDKLKEVREYQKPAAKKPAVKKAKTTTKKKTTKKAAGKTTKSRK